MMSDEGPVAIIAAHGDLAAGFVSAVQLITGRGDLFLPMSNSGLGAADIERAILELVDARKIRVIFTDLPAGSCTMAARRVIKARPDVVLVTGASLPLLLDFMSHDELGPAEAASHAVDRAVRSLVAVPGEARGH
ncbi:MAG: PTS sugar transporter subunit IIA [Gemmatimonadaceae bacterium]